MRSIADGIYVTDADHRIVVWNAGAEAITGYAEGDRLGRPCMEALGAASGDDQPCAVCHAQHQLAASADREIVSMTKLGQEVWLSVTASPVRDQYGNVEAVVHVFRDVSERRRIDRMKSEFISMISHELRTPLTSIRGFLGLALMERNGPLNERQQRFLETADQAAARLSHIIADLLNVSRIEAGRMSIARRPVALRTVIEAATHELRPQAEVKAPAAARLAAGPHATDLGRQRQAQPGLHEPARQCHQVHGHGRAHRRLGAEHVAAAWWRRCAIRDWIPAAALGTISIGSTRWTAPAPRRQGGTGLGLSIVKELVEMHGGRMFVDSMEGQGSSFSFSLPQRGRGQSARIARPAGSSKSAPIVLVN